MLLERLIGANIKLFIDCVLLNGQSSGLEEACFTFMCNCKRSISQLPSRRTSHEDMGSGGWTHLGRPLLTDNHMNRPEVKRELGSVVGL